MTNEQKQHLLAYLGYYTIDVDDIWGDSSIGATKKFQSAYGLPATGVCDTETEKALKHAISYGMPVKKDTTWNG